MNEKETTSISIGLSRVAIANLRSLSKSSGMKQKVVTERLFAWFTSLDQHQQLEILRPPSGTDSGTVESATLPTRLVPTIDRQAYILGRALTTFIRGRGSESFAEVMARIEKLVGQDGNGRRR